MTFRTFRVLLATLLMIGITGTAATTWAACSNPTGEEGAMVYNRDYKTMQFCNGTDWMAMGGVFTVPWQTSGTNVYYNGGNVGVGTASPAEKIDLNGGNIKMGYERLECGPGVCPVSSGVAYLNCSAGKQSIGGGCECPSGYPIRRSYGGATSWACVCGVNAETSNQASVLVICANIK